MARDFDEDVRRLVDRAAIQDLHARYFGGLDACDSAQVRSCFTEDVRARYDGRSPLRPDGKATSGIEELMDLIVTFLRLRSGEWKVTTHFMGKLVIELVGVDAARTEVQALAFIVLPRPDGDKVAIRSLRYIDRLRRDDFGWRICERRHTLDWSSEVAADFAVSVAERITG